MIKYPSYDIMELKKSEVQKIAKLARLELTEQETDFYNQELAEILEWVEHLGEVDTTNVEPMRNPLQSGLPMREDEVTDTNLQQDIMQNTPQSQFGCFVVPKVVE